ncbi:MAG: chaperone NapD [Granulosicoccus sp.]
MQLSRTVQTQTLEFNPQCHIASMVIYCKPQHQTLLVSACGELTDSEVYTDERDTAFVLVLERASEGALRETIDQINALMGVINVSLVYHHCESSQTLSEPLS